MITLFAWFGVVFAALIGAGVVAWGIGKLLEGMAVVLKDRARTLKDLHTRQNRVTEIHLQGGAMWVARDKNGELNLYKTKPSRNNREEFWEVDDLENMVLLPSGLLPEIRWEEGPDEVELRIMGLGGGA